MRAGRFLVGFLLGLAAVVRCTSSPKPVVDAGGSDATTDTVTTVDAGSDVSDGAAPCTLPPPYPTLNVQCDAGMMPSQLCLNATGITCATGPMDCDSGVFLMCGAGSTLCGANACCLDPTAEIDAGCPDMVTLLPGAINATMCGGSCPGGRICSTNADCIAAAPTCIPAVFSGTTVNFGICH
jgi:hypothetical protein